MGQRLFSKIKAMNQVVFDFMNERSQQRIDQNTHPCGDKTLYIEPSRNDHPYQGERHDTRAQRILVLQDRITLSQVVSMVRNAPSYLINLFLIGSWVINFDGVFQDLHPFIL